VLPIGEWMLDTACRQAVAWRGRFGDAAPPLAVNLPPAQASDPDLVAAVNRALGETGLPAHGLQLALPVRSLLRGDGDAEDNLQVLAEMGVPTSIHGFGDGYGGLVFLEDLPVTSVWIAGWLVRRMADRPESVTGRALAGLISLVHTFAVRVTVAEIATAEQARWWRGIGADVACGALFGEPGPPDELTDLLARSASPW
jgi:EAL domain-containing protein (putative c-di-GMP-specific phosphodiesterase class I)